MNVLLWAALALSAELSCTSDDLTAPPATLSVVWVSPLGKSATANAWLQVVPAAELRKAAVEADGRTGRLLQLLGLRSRSSAPTRDYKVVIFDVERDHLCRPIHGAEPPDEIAGTIACPMERHARPDKGHDGCGHSLDRSDDAPSGDIYRARWADLARNGFCLLPLDRYVEDAIRR